MIISWIINYIFGFFARFFRYEDLSPNSVKLNYNFINNLFIFFIRIKIAKFYWIYIFCIIFALGFLTSEFMSDIEFKNNLLNLFSILFFKAKLTQTAF